MSDTTEMLTEYGRTLVAAGFEVWLTRMYPGGYLQYRDPATGFCGSLQYSSSEMEWQHLMPIVPSVEYGSSMFIEDPADPFTVEAARECARFSNRNDVVGRRVNARELTWRSPSAVALHAAGVAS